MRIYIYINSVCYAGGQVVIPKKHPRIQLRMLSLVELITMASQSLLRIIVLIKAKLLMHKN